MADYAVTVVFIVKAIDERDAYEMVDGDIDYLIEMIDDNSEWNPYVSSMVVETSQV